MHGKVWHCYLRLLQIDFSVELIRHYLVLLCSFHILNFPRAPLATGYKLKVHWTSKTSSERLTYFQFMTCVQELKSDTITVTPMKFQKSKNASS